MSYTQKFGKVGSALGVEFNEKMAVFQIVRNIGRETSLTSTFSRDELQTLRGIIDHALKDTYVDETDKRPAA